MATTADKSVFDVYGMLTILTFVLMAGACYLLYEDLSTNWHFQMFGDKPSEKRASHITELRPIGVNLPTVILRPEDKADWDLIDEKIKGGKEFPIKTEWPKDYDPIKFHIKPSVNVWDMTKDPTDGEKWKAALEALLNAAPKEDAAEPTKPAEPEKKADDTAAKPPDAPKTEEVKKAE